ELQVVLLGDFCDFCVSGSSGSWHPPVNRFVLSNLNLQKILILRFFQSKHPPYCCHLHSSSPHTPHLLHLMTTAWLAISLHR
ncbi:hypothetical protein EMPG_14231, partial [Blastomyces silverae]